MTTPAQARVSCTCDTRLRLIILSSIITIPASPAFSRSAYSPVELSPRRCHLCFSWTLCCTLTPLRTRTRPVRRSRASAISRLPDHALEGGAFPHPMCPVREPERVPCAGNAVFSTTMYPRHVNLSDPTRRVMRNFSPHGTRFAFSTLAETDHRRQPRDATLQTSR
ncbi:hypothetical protein OH77DRAFT_115016 [Trametes cingulata]|nr:hypothetical protein OH77DRAFT_115016 [Trametes cingulata]